MRPISGKPASLRNRQEPQQRSASARDFSDPGGLGHGKNRE